MAKGQMPSEDNDKVDVALNVVCISLVVVAMGCFIISSYAPLARMVYSFIYHPSDLMK